MNINGIQVDIERVAAATGMTVADVIRFIRVVHSALSPVSRTFSVVEDGEEKTLTVTRVGIGPIVTEFGRFWQIEFEIDDEWGQYEVLLKADLDLGTLMPIFDTSKTIIVRPDSGCATGQRFTDRTCDCREQLHLTMKKIADVGQGIIIHMPTQDGRGKGLGFKLATLWLQDELEVNTVESASLLTHDGFIDVRTYGGAIAILKFLGVLGGNGDGPNSSDPARLIVAANNPEKGRVFVENGCVIVGRDPVAVAPTEYTLHHFQAKKSILGHAGLVA